MADLHGKDSSYHRGCRCDRCRTAHTESVRRNRANRKQALLSDPNHPRHGMSASYDDGCRCDRCKAAKASFRRGDVHTEWCRCYVCSTARREERKRRQAAKRRQRRAELAAIRREQQRAEQAIREAEAARRAQEAREAAEEKARQAQARPPKPRKSALQREIDYFNSLPAHAQKWLLDNGWDPNDAARG